MKIRIMSDLHLDVNSNYPLQLPEKDKGVFTILAGDTAGEVADGIFWIRDNCPYGVCVAGNHLVYNHYGKTIQNLKEDLKQEFPQTSTMTFLENDYKQIDNNTIVVGATLYTDFHLDGIPTHIGMRVCKRSMNDYRWGLYQDNDEIVGLKPEHYLSMFNESLAYIKKVCEDNPDKQIIVVTHHAPSNQAIMPSYRGSDSNCGYASNLGGFITQHPNIKAWIYGHCHAQTQFKIGDCICINNSRGYVQYKEDMNWNPCFYLDTETWETSSDDSWFNREMSDEEKKRREDLDKAYEVLFRAL